MEAAQLPACATGADRILFMWYPELRQLHLRCYVASLKAETDVAQFLARQ
jgi:hypothetical protein